jgi:hypothetical protein
MATVRIQLRRGTSSQWDGANPTLAAGEIGIETDTNTFKFGDGVTAWNDLSYALSDTVDDYIPLALKGVANGVAELDGSGKVPYSQIPSIDELSQDAVNAALIAGTGITKVYNDGSNTITVAVDTSVIATKAELAEVSQDSINDALVAGTGLNKTYDDVNNLITIDVDTTEIATRLYAQNVVSDHNDTTLNVHGIANTAQLATQTYANNAAASAQSNAETYADGLITNLINGAPAALNTLNELAIALGNDDNFANVVMNDLSYKAPSESPTFTGNVSLPATTSIGTLDSAKIGYLTDITSPLQEQLDLKAPLESPTFTGTVTMPGSTHIGSVSDTEIGYLNGVTSSVQGQIDSKLNTTDAASTYAPLESPTFTGTVMLPGSTAIGDVGATEIGYLNGVTSSVQNQIDLKAPLESPTFTGTVTLPNATVTNSMIADLTIATGKIADTAITADKLGADAVTTEKIINSAVTEAKIADSAVTSGKIANGTIVNADINDAAAIDWTKLAVSSTVSATELGYVDGVTSSIQTQLDAKAPTASPTFTGTVSGITKSMVGLGNVDNTSDANKPVSTATQAALDLKADLSSPTFTGTVVLPNTTSVGTVSSTEIGYLDGVTSSIQTQIDTKAASTDVSAHTSATTSVHGISDTAQLAYKNAADQTFTGNLEVDGNMTVDGNLTVNGTTFNASATTITIEDNLVQLAHQNAANTVDLGIVVAYNDGTAKHAGIVRDVSANKWKLFEGVTDEPSTTVNFAQGTLDDLEVADITASSATIGNVSNTELQYLDGVTSSIQTQLDAKAPTASPTFTGTVSGITKSMVGLGNVDNTSDANKPVSTATQTALDLKANLASPTFTGTVTVAASGIAFTDGTQTKEGVPSRTTVDSKTADYTLVLTDRDKMIEVNSSSALTISIPTDASVNFPIGTSIDLLRVGSGAVTIAAATPATTTLNHTPGNKLRAQWSSATLFKRAANTWVLMGDLTA